MKDYASELIEFADKINDPEPIQAILPTFDEEESAEEDSQQESLEGLSASEVVDSLVDDLKKQEKKDYVANPATSFTRETI